MLHVVRSCLAPLWSTVFLMLGLSFFMSFLSIRIQLAGFEENIVGYVHSAYFAGMLFGSLSVEKLIRRIGHIRAFSAFASLATITILFLAMAIVPLYWVGLRFLSGFSLAGLYVTIESWLLDKSTVNTRGQILSLYMIALYLSQAVSQFFLDTFDFLSLTPFLIAGILCTAAVIPVSMTRSKSPDLHEPTFGNIFELFLISPFGFLGCLFSGVILSNFYSFAPNFAVNQDIPVSLLMSSTIIGGALLQWPLGKLSDHVDRRKVLVCSSFLTVIPALVVFFYSANPSIVYVGAFFLGGFSFSLYPLSLTHVCDRVETRNITAVTGVLLLGYGLGSCLGPLISPLFMNGHGASIVYPFIAVVAASLGCIGIISLMIREKVPLEEQEEFVALPNLTPVAYDMDPRAPEES